MTLLESLGVPPPPDAEASRKIYEKPLPDQRVSLVHNGQVVGVFTNPELREETKQFLQRLPR